MAVVYIIYDWHGLGSLTGLRLQYPSDGTVPLLSGLRQHLLSNGTAWMGDVTAEDLPARLALDLRVVWSHFLSTVGTSWEATRATR